MIFIVDASFVVDSLFSGAKAFLNRTPHNAVHFAAPHLLDAEVGQVLRRYYLSRALSDRTVDDARLLFSSLRLTRYEHLPLMSRSLQLKDNMTFYDALYVSLAEALDGVLLTRDDRLRAAVRSVSRVQTRDSPP